MPLRRGLPRSRETGGIIPTTVCDRLRSAGTGYGTSPRCGLNYWKLAMTVDSVPPAKFEGAGPVPFNAVTKVPLSRSELLVSHCDLSGYGLEIGPSYNPIVPKKTGYRVDTLDHADAATLREKYRNHDIDLSSIEEVTYVWSGEPLHELTQKTAHYNWIIASHVIEHTTDLVSFLAQCEHMLRAGGILSLAIPDHRYCFDIFRPVSTSGEVIQAFVEKRRRHSVGALFDHFSMGATKQGALGWDSDTAGDYSLIHETVAHAQFVLDMAQKSDEYIDIHNWRFTPASFKLILADICSLGYLNMSIKSFYPTQGFEFVCQLQKNPDSVSALAGNESRLDLLMQIANGSRIPIPG